MNPRLAVVWLLATAVFAMSTAHAEDKAPGDAVLGKYWFPKKNGKMEIRREKGLYFGKIIAYDKEGALDKYNPDEELRKRPVVGIDMLENFSYDPKKQQWASGTIYDGDSGKTYNATIWFENNDLSKLNARGYVGISLFGRTEVFERVTEKDEKRAEAPAGEGKK